MPWQKDGLTKVFSCFIPWKIWEKSKLPSFIIKVRIAKNSSNVNWEPPIAVVETIEQGDFKKHKAAGNWGAGILYPGKDQHTATINYKHFLEAIINNDEQTMNKVLYPLENHETIKSIFLAIETTNGL
jgi:hypothetical protein